MFIGYNKARRSGLAKKDFLPEARLLSPLRIRALRSSMRDSCPDTGHDIMNCDTAS